MGTAEFIENKTAKQELLDLAANNAALVLPEQKSKPGQKTELSRASIIEIGEALAGWYSKQDEPTKNKYKAAFTEFNSELTKLQGGGKPEDKIKMSPALAGAVSAYETENNLTVARGQIGFRFIGHLFDKEFGTVSDLNKIVRGEERGVVPHDHKNENPAQRQREERILNALNDWAESKNYKRVDFNSPTFNGDFQALVKSYQKEEMKLEERLQTGNVGKLTARSLRNREIQEIERDMAGAPPSRPTVAATPAPAPTNELNSNAGKGDTETKTTTGQTDKKETKPVPPVASASAKSAPSGAAEVEAKPGEPKPEPSLKNADVLKSARSAATDVKAALKELPPSQQKEFLDAVRAIVLTRTSRETFASSDLNAALAKLAPEANAELGERATQAVAKALTSLHEGLRSRNDLTKERRNVGELFAGVVFHELKDVKVAEAPRTPQPIPPQTTPDPAKLAEVSLGKIKAMREAGIPAEKKDFIAFTVTTLLSDPEKLSRFAAQTPQELQKSIAETARQHIPHAPSVKLFSDIMTSLHNGLRSGDPGSFTKAVAQHVPKLESADVVGMAYNTAAAVRALNDRKVSASVMTDLVKKLDSYLETPEKQKEFTADKKAMSALYGLVSYDSAGNQRINTDQGKAISAVLNRFYNELQNRGAEISDGKGKFGDIYGGEMRPRLAVLLKEIEKQQPAEPKPGEPIKNVNATELKSASTEAILLSPERQKQADAIVGHTNAAAKALGEIEGGGNARTVFLNTMADFLYGKRDATLSETTKALTEISSRLGGDRAAESLVADALGSVWAARPDNTKSEKLAGDEEKKWKDFLRSTAKRVTALPPETK